jgi:hypothetical protein
VRAIAWSHEAHSPMSYHEMETVLTRQKLGSTFLNKRLVIAGGHATEGVEAKEAIVDWLYLTDKMKSLDFHRI